MTALPRKWLGLCAISALAAGCSGPPLDVPAVLAVDDVTTGWLDVGIDELGRNKLVPVISFRLANMSDDTVTSLQLNGIFRRCLSNPEMASELPDGYSPADPEAGTCAAELPEWGNSFIRAVGREGLSPGATTEVFTMQSAYGYTGEQARLEMLEHRDFVDVKVELFVKHQAEQWARLGELRIDRQLLTP